MTYAYRYKTAVLVALIIATQAACISKSAESDAVQIQTQPQNWSAYLSAAQQAERIEDPVQRCLAYPDLPGNQWPVGAAKARCPLLAFKKPEAALAELASTLEEADGAQQLDRRYAALLDAHHNDAVQREAIYVAYSAFDASDQARRIAERWLADAPDSPYAQTALGLILLTAAGEARGSEFYADTPESKLQTMQRLLAQAKPLLQSAQRTAPRLSPACIGLMRIGNLEGDSVLRDAATQHCLKVDPLSWNVRFEWQRSLDPLWGGSFEALDQSVEQIRPLVKQNPALGGMLARGVGMRAYVPVTQGQPRANYAAGFEAAARIAPDPLFIGNAGLIAQEQNDLPKALAYLSQAIRLAPTSYSFLSARAEVRRKSGDLQGAVSDAGRAIVIDSAPGKIHATLGQALSKLGKTEEARAAFETAMQSPRQRRWAFMRWCETFILGNLMPAQALSCSQGLLQEYPENAEALFMRSWVLYEVNDPAAAEVEARFRRVVDAGDKRQREMASELTRLSTSKAKPSKE